MFSVRQPDPPERHHRPHRRDVRPPRAVRVRLDLVYPIPEPAAITHPDALDLRGTVDGELHLWQRTTTGQWVGWVAYAVTVGGEITYIAGWVPASALTPA